MLGLLITLVIVGLIAGFIARALVPGKQSMSVLATMGLGIIGSFVGGFIGYLIHKGNTKDFFHPAGLLGSIVGAIVVLLVYMAMQRRSSRV